MVEFICIGCWGVYVFRDSHGDSDFTRTFGERDGEGTGAGVIAGGPALSLPNMLVIRSVMGTQRRWCMFLW
jgi:uncharacterized membrane protein YraQ (UPF0718 family)